MKRETFAYFIAPSVVAMVLLMIVPLVTAIWLGFHFITFRNVNAPEFVGLANYVEVLTDPDFWDAMAFTMIFIIVVVPLHILIGFVIALLLDQTHYSRAFYISGSLMPFIVTPVVGTLMFRQIFDRGGLYPYLLEQIGWDVNFFISGAFVRGLILFHGVWYITPFAMITLFAGLQTVPKEPLEAAIVDGANWFQRLWHVVIPHLRSLLLFIALISIMDAYRIFDSVFVLSKQNPAYNAETIMYYTYQTALSFQRLGKANAMAVITVIGIFVVLIPFLIITYRQQVAER